MVLSEITPGTSVQIVATRGIQTAEFNTAVIETDTEDMTIKVEPIYQDEKLVGFDIEDISLAVYVASKEEEKVFQFPDVKIRSFKASDGTVYQEIQCNTGEGKVVNRRGACRVWIGSKGSVILGEDIHPHDVVVKDISATGVAFVCDESTEVSMGMPIIVSFTDEKTNDHFRLAATVVRYADAEHRRTVYGCRFKGEHGFVSKYVVDKQREQLKATRTVGDRR